MANLVEENGLDYEVLRREYLEYKNVAENSNKFYELTALKLVSSGRGSAGRTGRSHAFKTRWGKIGTQGQSGFGEYSTEDDAMQVFENVMREKIKKGYQSVSSTPLTNPPKAKAEKPKLIEVETEWDLT